MDFRAAYDRFQNHSLAVERLRRRGFFSRHLLSVPRQWARDCREKRTIRALETLEEFEPLAGRGDGELVVALTSFPARIGRLHLVIRSILLLDHPPHKVFLCFTSDEFPGGFDSLPAKLRALVPYGLEVVFVEGGLRSHNKYFEAMRRFPDKVVITLDDDLIYHRDTITRLLATHRAFPQAVCANRVREIEMCDGRFASYAHWGRPYPDAPACSERYVALGYTGVLYPVGSYRDALLNAGSFTQLAPLADDLWLKAVELEQGVGVAIGGGYFAHPVTVPGSQKITLRRLNDGQRKNDRQWEALDAHFGLMNLLKRP